METGPVLLAELQMGLGSGQLLGFSGHGLQGTGLRPSL